jgi:NAD(P)-dependent dehydrogenase (short-subunit alcohol dehydrogenase family)
MNACLAKAFLLPRNSNLNNKRQALITGANKGIGLAIAKGLAEAGFFVWIGARDVARGEHAVAELRKAGLDAGFLELDVADDASVQDAATTLAAHIEALDVLVNNAGIAVDMTRAPSQVRMRDMKAVYEVNLFGPVRVTQAFLPLLKAADQARVVMMGSGVGSLTLITDPTSLYSTVNLLDYTSSKVALNAVTVSFAKELAPLGIKVNAVEPGHVRTDLNGNSGVLTPEEGAAIAIKMALLESDGPTGGFFGSHGRQPW